MTDDVEGRGTILRPVRRALSTLAAVVCLAPVLVSCSDEPDEPLPGNDDGPAMLRVKEAESVLLKRSDLGKGFKGKPTSEAEAAQSYGCLGVLDQAQTNQQFQVESRYQAVADDYTIIVSSQVSTYETLGEPRGDMSRFRKAVSSCEETSENRDGTVYDLEFVLNDTTTTKPAEDQLNVQASGTVTNGDGTTRTAYVGYATTRVGNNVVAVNVTVLGDYEDPLDDLVRYNNIVIKRLVETAEPVPTESPSESSDDESAAG